MIAYDATETRPHYGGTLRVMMQSAPNALDLPANATPADYWDLRAPSHSSATRS